jgi:hypothetical protein
LEAGSGVAAEGTRIPFIARTGPDGKKTVLAFSSDAALLAWRPEGCDTVELAVPDLCKLALDSSAASVTLNPNGPAGGLIFEDELRALAEGRAPDAPGLKAKLPGLPPLSSPPAPPPEPSVAALRASAAERPEVLSIRWAVAVLDGQERSVIVLKLAPGAPPDDVVPALIEGALARLTEGAIPDALVLPPGVGAVEGVEIFKR